MLLLAVITVRIGVFGLFHPTHLSVEAPPQQVLLINGIPKHSVDIKWNAAQAEITARDGGATDFILTVPGKIQRHFRGTLLISTVGDELIPVVTMDLEQAVTAVVAAEYPDGTHIETLKAGAVLARSYYTASGKRHQTFEFCDTTHCQFHRAPPSPQHAATKATRATAGLTINYHNRTFAPLYSASCGGSTRTAASVGLQSYPYPYFSVDCPECRRSSRFWTRRIEMEVVSSEQFRLQQKIPSNNFFIDKLTHMIHGRGEGHGVGLCQLGSNSMAAGGASFRDILNHYYPNTTCSPLSQP